MAERSGLFDKNQKFEADAPRVPLVTALVVDLDGFEGPLDILLLLARGQKVDLLKISILELAEQYLTFIEKAQKLQLEIAADYLVMAAWLAFLKSRLLVPQEEDDESPSGEELAERLALQLKKLEAMRGAAEKLMNGTLTGRDRLKRGRPEGITVIRHSKYDCSLRDLLIAYAQQEERKGIRNPLCLKRDAVFSVEAALQRLENMLGKLPEWADLRTYIPKGISDPFAIRSAEASTLLASLQLVKEGQMELRQLETFGPITVRKISRRDEK